MLYVASSLTSSTKSKQKLEKNILYTKFSKTRKSILRRLEHVKEPQKQKVKWKREQRMQNIQEKDLLQKVRDRKSASWPK